MKASVEWAPMIPTNVILTMSGRDYSTLLACLRSHADNEIIEGYVVNCRCAASILLAIANAVSADKNTSRQSGAE